MRCLGLCTVLYVPKNNYSRVRIQISFYSAATGHISWYVQLYRGESYLTFCAWYLYYLQRKPATSDQHRAWRMQDGHGTPKFMSTTFETAELHSLSLPILLKTTEGFSALVYEYSRVSEKTEKTNSSGAAIFRCPSE